MKHGPQMHWAHKASILGVPEQGIPLVALAMTDAANHDSKSIIGSLEFTRINFPKVLDYALSLYVKAKYKKLNIQYSTRNFQYSSPKNTI